MSFFFWECTIGKLPEAGFCVRLIWMNSGESQTAHDAFSHGLLSAVCRPSMQVQPFLLHSPTLCALNHAKLFWPPYRCPHLFLCLPMEQAAHSILLLHADFQDLLFASTLCEVNIICLYLAAEKNGSILDNPKIFWYFITRLFSALITLWESAQLCYSFPESHTLPHQSPKLQGVAWLLKETSGRGSRAGGALKRTFINKRHGC